MKNKLFINLGLALSLSMGIGFSGAKKQILAAVYESSVSPKLNCSCTTYLQKEGAKIFNVLQATRRDNDLEINLSSFPALDNEVLFAVFIDPRKGIIGRSFLEGITYNAKCNFSVPFDSDIVDIHIYKQKIGDPAFVIKEENFLGHSKIFMSHDAIFYRPQGSIPVNAYDEEDNPISQEVSYLTRITPNFYSLQGPFPTATYNFDYAEIILPEDKADLLTDDEKIVISTAYRVVGELGENVVAEGTTAINFYLPDGIDEFKIKYHLLNGDGVETGSYNYYINLEK